MSDAQIFVGQREAARLLSVSERTLWRWVKNGDCPATKIGGRTLFSPEALRAWAAAKMTAPSPSCAAAA